MYFHMIGVRVGIRGSQLCRYRCRCRCIVRVPRLFNPAPLFTLNFCLCVSHPEWISLDRERTLSGTDCVGWMEVAGQSRQNKGSRPANKGSQSPRQRANIFWDKCCFSATVWPDMGRGRAKKRSANDGRFMRSHRSQKGATPATLTLTLSTSTAGSGAAESGFVIESTEA